MAVVPALSLSACRREAVHAPVAWSPGSVVAVPPSVTDRPGCLTAKLDDSGRCGQSSSQSRVKSDPIGTS
jgi:hypothetical protein